MPAQADATTRASITRPSRRRPRSDPEEIEAGISRAVERDAAEGALHPAAETARLRSRLDQA